MCLHVSRSLICPASPSHTASRSPRQSRGRGNRARPRNPCSARCRIPPRRTGFASSPQDRRLRYLASLSTSNQKSYAVCKKASLVGRATLNTGVQTCQSDVTRDIPVQVCPASRGEQYLGTDRHVRRGSNNCPPQCPEGCSRQSPAGGSRRLRPCAARQSHAPLRGATGRCRAGRCVMRRTALP